MVRASLPLLASALVALVAAQTPGTSPEVHPKITTYKCTKRGGCVKKKGAIVLDQLAHPVHQKNNTSLGCGNWGSPPNVTVCPDKATCAKNCIVEGVSDYSKYGVTTKGSSLYLDMLRDSDLSSLSPRVYLLAEGEKKYEMLKLTGQEFTFDVDMSKLPCGMNGALYLSEMLETGGQSKLNPGGAYYGSGYCDAQCFTTPFINGEGNIAGKGACCNEMDIWEANARATSIAPHPCNITRLYECDGVECSWDGVCDEWGCGMNPYANGNPNFYGLDKIVNTKKKFTVVTRFPAKNGKLVAIERDYVQNGKLIHNAVFNTSSLPKQNFMNDTYCEATGGATRFLDLGGLEAMGEALSRGMVLAFSIWWDEGGNMTWLDSGNAGPCTAEEGNPSVIRVVQPDTKLEFSEMKWGEIGSTCSH